MSEVTVETPVIAKKRTIISRDMFVAAILKGSAEGMTKKEVCEKLLDGMKIQTLGQRLKKMNDELTEAGEDTIELKDGRSGGTRAVSFVELVKRKKLEAIQNMDNAVEQIEQSA